MSLKSRLRYSVLLVLALIILQQGIVRATDQVSVIDQQADFIRANDLDPSALFYMEIDVARHAEKEVRQALSSDEAMPVKP